MPEVDRAPSPVSRPGRAGLHIVLFGMPAAGKSSLLGALAQAAKTQEDLLGGHLLDLSHGLAELERRLYGGVPEQTVREVVPYAVSFEPLHKTGANGADGPVEAVLVDCDGRVANELLMRKRSLEGDTPEGSLARAILDADALILTVDASSRPEQLDGEFAEFGRFLQLFEETRGQRSDVGGLPVFLVLTKCDLLAGAKDSSVSWMEKIEQRKRDVVQHFQEFLAGRRAAGLLPFGSVALHLWATAVKRPALADSPARPQEPYGVAELFRQCIGAARGFRRRRERSSRRLFLTTAGTAGVAVTLLALAGILLVHRSETQENLLALKVNRYQEAEGATPAARLSDARGELQRRIGTLTAFREDPGFHDLPPDLRAYVEGRLKELQDYRAYKQRLEHLHPAEARRASDLAQVEALLGGGLALPEPYQQEWSETQAGQLHTRLLKEVHALRDAVADTEDWYRQHVRKAEELTTFARNPPTDARSWTEWDQQLGELLAEAAPHAETDEVSGPVTYETVFRFDAVAAARNDWEVLRGRLRHLKDLVAALGLAGTLPNGERQPLDIPDHITAEQASSYLRRLEKLYPDLARDNMPVELPEAITPEIRRAARTSYDHLIEGGRAVVLQHLQQVSPEGKETRAGWSIIRDWLMKTPAELADWRILATLLARLQDPAAGDPVNVLADFLGQPTFDIELKLLALEIPYDLKLRPGVDLAVHHQPGDQPVAPLPFHILDEDGKPDSQRRVTVYAFQRETPAAVVYHPGDQFWVDVPVKRDGDKAEWLLTWSQCRSQMYQFERLVRTPRLHRKEQESTAGKIAEGVVLRVTQGSKVPVVPDLMPVVKLQKR